MNVQITSILNRLKYVHPWQILLSLYNTRIMSHSKALWTPFMGCKIYELKHPQKKAVRTIKHNRPLAPSEPVFERFGTFKFARPVSHNNTEVLLQARL